MLQLKTKPRLKPKTRQAAYAAVLAERRKATTKLLSPYGVEPSGVIFLTDKKRISPQVISERLKRMQEAKVPRTGLVWKLSLAEPAFGDVIKRYAERRGLTSMKYDLYNFLLQQGISEKTAMRLATKSRKTFKLKDMQAKIDFFESTRLDPNVYGVERIPVSEYEKLLDLCLSDIKRRGMLKKTVLWKLEDRHAARLLSSVLPGWSKSETFQKMRASTVLERTKTCIANGIKPSPYVISNYSAKSIADGTAKTKHNLSTKRLMKQIEPTPLSKFFTMGSYETPRQIKGRHIIVEALISRPHLTVRTRWLINEMKKKHGYSKNEFSTIAGQLTDLGVISRQDGHIRLTKYFRIGDKRLSDYPETWFYPPRPRKKV